MKLRPYAVAALVIAACIPVAQWLGPATNGPPPVMVLLVGITITAWHGGRGPAVFASALALAVAHVFFLSPELKPWSPPDETRFALMAAVAICISLLAGSLHEARDALRRETARLRSFLDNLPAGFVVYDGAGRLVHANRHVEQHTGYQPMPSLDAPFGVLDAEGRPIARKDYATSRALMGESTLARQVRYVRPGGDEAWLEVSAVPIREEGRVVGALTMTHDISELKRLQLELVASRARLELAQAAGGIGSFDYDLVSRRALWSPELDALHGFAHGDGTRAVEEWMARVHPEDLPQALRDIDTAVANGSFMSQWRIVRPDGAVRHIEAQGRVVRDDAGRPVRLMGVNIDVTERRETQARLHEAERRLEIALEAARMGRWHIDLTTGLMDASATCRANFGRLPHERFEYEDVVASVHPDDRAAMEAAVERALESRQEYAAEYRVVWPDGTVRWIAARGRATYDGDGRALVMDGVTIDFTSRKRLEEELRSMTLSLQEADRRKDQFLAVLGHELRNPLAPMRNAMSLIRMRGEAAELRESALGVMERQMAQLRHLVDELLDVSRIAQGKVRLEREPVALARLLREAAEAAEPLMLARHHRFRLELPAEEAIVVADRGRIVQVVTNLLNNAAKYTDERGEIALELEVAGAVALIRVTDNGIGIAPDLQARIFELFSQADAALDRAQGGLGLGLNVARRLVEMHDGTIGVQSDGPGRGSVFTVTLPLAVATAAHPRSAARHG